MPDQSLPKAERLSGRDRIAALFEAGEAAPCGPVLVRALPNDLPHGRVAVIVGRKAGKAHQRNRIRRRLRAAYRSVKERLPPGFDWAVVARRGAIDTPLPRLAEAIVAAAERAARRWTRGDSS